MFTLGAAFDLSPPELAVWLVATSEMLVAAVLLVCAAAACAADPSNIVIVADQVGGHGALMIVYPTIT
jgi:acetyl esterase/lipase